MYPNSVSLIGGNANSGLAMDGLLGLKLMELMDPEKSKEMVAVAEIVETKPKKDNINP